MLVHSCVAYFLAVLLMPCGFPANATEPDFLGATPLQWSSRMANAEMERRGDSLCWTDNGTAKWDYATGLFVYSLLKLNESVPDAKYVRFAEKTLGSFITADGDIRGYKKAEFQLDSIEPGRALLALYDLTGQERYRLAAERLIRQLDAQPRNDEGGFWHKQRYPSQMWLDGIYMASPFRAEFARRFGGPPGAFDDIALQVRVISAHTFDPRTGLFYHGWDESKRQDWANPGTGCSSNFWARGVGWFGMGIVDTLDYFPTNYPARAELLATLNKVCAGIARAQDPVTGLWFQVLDRPGRAGNYAEASGSAMFIYLLSKAVSKNYVQHALEPDIEKGYVGILQRLVKKDSQGRLSLTRCCSVAGLGYGRDGSFDYYIREPVVDNDLKGVSPFILAGVELHHLDADGGRTTRDSGR